MPSHAIRAYEALTPSFTNFEKKNRLFCSLYHNYTSLIILKWKDYPASRVNFDLLKKIKGPWKEIGDSACRVWKIQS